MLEKKGVLKAHKNLEKNLKAKGNIKSYVNFSSLDGGSSFMTVIGKGEDIKETIMQGLLKNPDEAQLFIDVVADLARMNVETHSEICGLIELVEKMTGEK